MMTFWLLIPAPIRNALAWIGGAIAVAWGFYQAGRRSAHKDRDTDELKSTVKAHEVRNEVENRVASERDARERLRRDWSEQ